jgi:membrane-bound metal-dependent hydrolase YbcI (DUF457 family)
MFLDIAVGIVSAIAVSGIFDVALTVKLLLFGIGFALLPDIDALWGWLRPGFWWNKGKWGHRELTHYPLVQLVASIIVFLAFGKVWGLLYFFGVFAHLIHDSIDAWGIKWLWPFSDEVYSLLYSKERGFKVSKDKLSTRSQGWETKFFWTWMRTHYIKKVLPFEIVALVLALIVLWIYR